MQTATNNKQRFFNRYPKLTIVLLLVIIALFIDFLLGLFLIPEDINAFRAPHPYYHHCLLPNQSVKTTWDAQYYYPFHTNSLGFRDKSARKINKNSDRHRILLLGDSHTEGVGVKYEETFAGILQERLERKNIEVLNAAAVSYSPKLYYYKTKYLIEEEALDFDELMVFIDISDIQNELVYKDFEPGVQSFIDRFFINSGRFLKRNSFLYYSISKLVERKRTQKFYEEARRVEKNPKTDIYSTFFDQFHSSELLRNQQFHNIGLWYLDKEVFEKWGREGLILEKWYMEKLAELCKTLDIDLHVAVYPWPVQIVAGDRNSIQVQFWEKFCKDHQAHFVNLFPLFFDRLREQDVVKDYYIRGDVHFNENGHRLVADYLSGYFSSGK